MTIRMISVFLVFLLSGGSLGLSFRSEQEPQQIVVEVIDGIFNKLDKENQTISLFLDSDRKISYDLKFHRIRSIYLIQGQEKKLTGLLKYAIAGGSIGLTSKIMIDLKNRTAETSDGKKFDLIGAAVWTVGSAGAAALAGYFKDKKEEDPRPFPIYDPEIKSNTSGSGGNNNGGNGKVDYGDIKRLELLTPGVSFVRIMLKETGEAAGDKK